MRRPGSQVTSNAVCRNSSIADRGSIVHHPKAGGDPLVRKDTRDPDDDSKVLPSARSELADDLMEKSECQHLTGDLASVAKAIADKRRSSSLMSRIYVACSDDKDNDDSSIATTSHLSKRGSDELPAIGFSRSHSFKRGSAGSFKSSLELKPVPEDKVMRRFSIKTMSFMPKQAEVLEDESQNDTSSQNL